MASHSSEYPANSKHQYAQVWLQVIPPEKLWCLRNTYNLSKFYQNFSGWPKPEFWNLIYRKWKCGRKPCGHVLVVAWEDCVCQLLFDMGFPEQGHHHHHHHHHHHSIDMCFRGVNKCTCSVETGEYQGQHVFLPNFPRPDNQKTLICFLKSQQ